MVAKKPTEKNKGGRPGFKPTAEQRRIVNIMAAGGFQQKKIADALEICQNTLLKHFRQELDAGGAKAEAMIVGNLYRQATKDDPRATPAAIFWAKTRLGWKEPHQVELSGPDGGPIQHSVEVVFVGEDDD
ncbi:putative DNA binding domain [Caudoviricetes sp.]|nr:putative DNA binding domain [Caudoviricetes sp.]UOF81480.1 putative DNA binding domain [Caudoviricetes sp.]